MRSPNPRSRPVLVLAALTPLLIGWQQPGPPAQSDGRSKWLADLQQMSDGHSRIAAILAPEDPEVAAHFRKNGWEVDLDWHFRDYGPFIFLNVTVRGARFGEATLTDEDYKMIARSKVVEALELRSVKCSDAGLKVLATSPRLLGIILGEDAVTDAGVKALAGCKTLQAVALLDTKNVTDAGVKALAARPNLRLLEALFITLDGSCFEPFAGSKTLASVGLTYVKGFTDDGARHLAKLPKLDDLKLTTGGEGEPNLTTAGVRAIVDARLPARFECDNRLIDDALFESLVAKRWLYGPTPPGVRWRKPATPADVESIPLGGSRVTDKGFAAALGCTGIRHLNLERTGITDETLKRFSGFSKLNFVSVGATKITGAGLEAIASLPIRYLTMEKGELTEDMFKAIGRMTTLERLWLSESRLKPEWLKHIRGLPKLKELHLREAAFDDAAVEHVATLKNLNELAVHKTNLTDAGFEKLLKQPGLERLYIDGTKVTEEAYRKAKQQFPKKDIYYNVPLYR